ncbi:MAG TPA: hypothetical protein VHQ69_07610 [Methylomirabilota bacterium]|nr:hypothetical protein [Methylomirabilota bacterium]
MTVDPLRRFAVPLAALVVALGVWWLITEDGFAQSSRLPTPYRTFSLELPVENLWSIVLNVLEDSEYTVISESRGSYSVVALGKPYEVRKGLRWISHRTLVTIEIQQKAPRIYDCFVLVQVQERWPIPGQWKVTPPGAEEEKQQEVLISLGRRLSQELRSHFRNVGG